MKNKINKNSIPQDFTIKLALVDFMPVLFFALAAIMISLSINSIILSIGAIICFLSGLFKVIWKIIVAVKRKNIWPLFIQMRIFMPIGFLIMIIGFIVYCINNDSSIFFNSLLNPVTIIFLIIGFIGMILMIVFAVKLNSEDSKSNWIEQLVNGFSQLSFFIAFLLAYIL